MPLAFESTIHGTVAFGFFNIDSDMLLLENRFFFATDLCELLLGISRRGEERIDEKLPAWIIEKPAHVGDLMGAIRGYRHVGFIGDTYLRYPFPAAPEDFKQKPEGHETRQRFVEMIEKYAPRSIISLEADRRGEMIAFGGIGFDRNGFHELVRYVWRGGYPRWRDEVRPSYVTEMKESLQSSESWLFDGIDWEV